MKILKNIPLLKITYHRAHRVRRVGYRTFKELDEREINPLTGNIIGAAIDVHRAFAACLSLL